ncbi:MAG: hypothetical protein COW18_09975 [Zetaproteobacteria bacterium CG12_big_fil_rev_8_21_14_0_65_54_13]|nr:MAG: hypothetical protein COW18_09975 [Zetaproteobacteria bacterium CG12_big_fil_rev_8_21_14_0_65_54_13]PIX54926.1 MAG: hypothetical protein COZ50_05445 [Zetaproteobacteria bacterium CG_4_10_14_3_um_filter_54_28]PJA31083.1 MAG: hypothetical protein CO188_00635 [Zetaproteobacteria bacterium CG_4_9_14_3_um_filter_54_145]
MQVKANINVINNIIKMQEVAANNIANINSNGFKASSAVQVGDRVNISPDARAAISNSAGEALSTTDPVRDMVAMKMNETALAANVDAMTTQQDMSRALLDLKK